MAAHNELGEMGESIAAKYLQENQYNILAQNYRCEKAEIDIICLKANEIVFVEVKTRSSSYYDAPSAAVDAKKEELLKQAALYFIEERQIIAEPRFDIISIIIENNKMEMEHIEDAFWG